MKIFLTYLSIIFISLLNISHSYAENNLTSKHWIIDAPTANEKEQRLEKYLRGFDQPMWEVGERYQMIKQAIDRENYDLASYHWDKIKVTIENGLMKRPARRKNAELILLNSTWQEIKTDINSQDLDKAKQGLQKMRSACLACHAAEGLPFINDQPMFND